MSLQAATLQSEASARAAEGTASQGPLTTSRNATEVLGMAFYDFTPEGAMKVPACPACPARLTALGPSPADARTADTMWEHGSRELQLRQLLTEEPNLSLADMPQDIYVIRQLTAEEMEKKLRHDHVCAWPTPAS